MGLDLQAVGRKSISEDIVRQITSLISSGELKPGDRLPPEREMCKQFKVGRSSLREALRTLSIVGILNARVGEGTYVAEEVDRFVSVTLEWGMLTDPKVFSEIMETRMILEGELAALAAKRIQVSQLNVLEKTVLGMEQALEVKPLFAKLDLEFHQVIAQASQNKFLERMHKTIWGYLQDWIAKTVAPVARPLVTPAAEAALADHKAIYEAIRGRNARAARRAMKQHIRNVEQLYRSFAEKSGTRW